MKFHFLNMGIFYIEHLYCLIKLKLAEICYTEDYEKQLMYHRGQIKSLEDLQQDIKDLLKKQEQ